MLLALAVAILAVPLLLQWSVLARRERHAPRALDLGLIFSWITALYGALPLLGFALAGWGIGNIQEARLGGEMPGQAQILRVGLMYLMFGAGFAACYARWRSRWRRAWRLDLMRATRTDVAFAIAMLLLTKGSMLVLRAALGIQSEDDYVASYTELAGQPLIVQQVAGVLGSMELATMVLVIVTLIARNPRWHLAVAAFVLLQIVATFVVGGSRTQAFAAVLAYLVARSVYDRRMRLSTVALWGALGLLGFLVAGAVRQSRVDTDEVTSLHLLQGSEFISVFVNALDLQERLADLDSAVLRIGMYLVDLLRFIPRQLIGDFKIDPATFYITTFYPEAAESGAGLAFGAVTEAAIGFGPLEALVRGALLGLCYVAVRNACLGQRISVVKAFIYTWFVVLAYQGIRDTTFSVFPRFFYQVLPVLLLMWLASVGGLRPRPRRRRRRPVLTTASPKMAG